MAPCDACTRPTICLVPSLNWTCLDLGNIGNVAGENATSGSRRFVALIREQCLLFASPLHCGSVIVRPEFGYVATLQMHGEW